MFDRISEGRWWDEGLQLVDGCTEVSGGCEHCWSRAMARFPRTRDLVAGGRWTGRVRFNDDMLDRPRRRRKPRAWAIWNDLFHEGVTDAQIVAPAVETYRMMRQSPQHIFIVLTKRAARMEEIVNRMADANVSVENPEGIPKNIWHMVTVENQAAADERIPHLMQTPSAVRGLSIEPMLGPVSLRQWLPRIDWVILGGESGPGARPMHPDWARSVRDQCVAAGVPFFFKQWGEYRPATNEEVGQIYNLQRIASRTVTVMDGRFDHADRTMIRVGKATAGRLLDGREWNEVPKKGAESWKL